MPPVLEPSKSKVDGLAFLGLSLAQNTDKGHPDSVTHQTAFDLNEVLDRDYEFVAATNDDGWLVGGGEPGPPTSYKLAAKDSAHVEIMRIGTYRKEWGGVPLDEIIKVMTSGDILIPQIDVLPTDVIANPDTPPELEIRFDMVPEIIPDLDDLDAPLPINWQLRFLHNQLFKKFIFPSRFCPGPFHSTILRKADFRSEEHRAKYFAKCQAAIEKWSKDGPQPLNTIPRGLDGEPLPVEEVEKLKQRHHEHHHPPKHHHKPPHEEKKQEEEKKEEHEQASPPKPHEHHEHEEAPAPKPKPHEKEEEKKEDIAVAIVPPLHEEKKKEEKPEDRPPKPHDEETNNEKPEDHAQKPHDEQKKDESSAHPDDEKDEADRGKPVEQQPKPDKEKSEETSKPREDIEAPTDETKASPEEEKHKNSEELAVDDDGKSTEMAEESPIVPTTEEKPVETEKKVEVEEARPKEAEDSKVEDEKPDQKDAEPEKVEEPKVEEGKLDSSTQEETKLGVEDTSSGIWLFTDRDNITHFFAPNFLPPYDTPEKKRIILDVLREEWDEKTLSWKPHGKGSMTKNKPKSLAITVTTDNGTTPPEDALKDQKSPKEKIDEMFGEILTHMSHCCGSMPAVPSFKGVADMVSPKK